ncbi:MAG: CoA-binding protein [Nitrospirae bacterium]|nr:CoA-binding protein [Nitrospirota bacterium]
MSAGTIAVVGASRNRQKFGNKCVRAYQSAGWEVLPVNLHEDGIEGCAVFRTLQDIQVPLDRVSLYLPPARTKALLAEMTEMRGVEVWFNPGSADPQVLEEATRLGIEVRDGCSIVDIGKSPAEFP